MNTSTTKEKSVSYLFYDKGMAFVEDASQHEKNHNLMESVRLYRLASEYLFTFLKYTKIPEERKQVKGQLVELVNRITRLQEEILAHSCKAHPPDFSFQTEPKNMQFLIDYLKTHYRALFKRKPSSSPSPISSKKNRDDLCMLTSLPREIVREILLRVDFRSLCRLSQSCKLLYGEITHDFKFQMQLWKRLFERDFESRWINDKLSVCSCDRNWKKDYQQEYKLTCILQPPPLKIEEVKLSREVKEGFAKTLILHAMLPRVVATKETSRVDLVVCHERTELTPLFQAIATKAKLNLIYVSARDLRNMKVWKSEEQGIQLLFQLATERIPSLLVIEHVEALCRQHHSYETEHNESSRRLTIELLVQLQRCNGERRPFIVLVSNKPWLLDAALIRRCTNRTFVPHLKMDDAVSFTTKKKMELWCLQHIHANGM